MYKFGWFILFVDTLVIFSDPVVGSRTKGKRCAKAGVRPHLVPTLHPIRVPHLFLHLLRLLLGIAVLARLS